VRTDAEIRQLEADIRAALKAAEARFLVPAARPAAGDEAHDPGVAD
jgi:hypothetical protein